MWQVHLPQTVQFYTPSLVQYPDFYWEGHKYGFESSLQIGNQVSLHLTRGWNNMTLADLLMEITKMAAMESLIRPISQRDRVALSVTSKTPAYLSDLRPDNELIWAETVYERSELGLYVYDPPTPARAGVIYENGGNHVQPADDRVLL